MIQSFLFNGLFRTYKQREYPVKLSQIWRFCNLGVGAFSKILEEAWATWGLLTMLSYLLPSPGTGNDQSWTTTAAGGSDWTGGGEGRGSLGVGRGLMGDGGSSWLTYY